MKKITWTFTAVFMPIGLILLNITQILDLAVGKQYSVNDLDSYEQLHQIKSMVLYDYKTMFNILVLNVFFILLYHFILKIKKYTKAVLIIDVFFIISIKTSSYMYESFIGSKEGFLLVNFNYISVFYLIIINCFLYMFLIFKACLPPKS